MTDIPRTLTEKWPGTLWRHSGRADDYSGLEWLDASPKPTEQEIADAWSEVQAQEAPPTTEDRLAALETEVQGIRDRTAATTVSDPDAAKVRDAVAGVQ